jgi:hypothetical protein
MTPQQWFVLMLVASHRYLQPPVSDLELLMADVFRKNMRFWFGAAIT